MLTRRALLALRSTRGLSLALGIRWQSTVKPAPPAPAAPHPPLTAYPDTPISSAPVRAPTAPKFNREKVSSIISLILASFVLGAGVAYTFPLSELAKLLAMEKLPPPNTPQAQEFQLDLERELRELDLFHKLSFDPGYKSIRAWSYIDSNTLSASINSGTLSVPGGFAIKPVLFVNESKKEIVAIVHVGQKLCGYPFLVHGGILASVLDEILKRGSAFMFGIDPLTEYMPDKIKTNLIELQYKSPTLANNFLVVRTSINEKSQVVGDVETLKGRLLVKGIGEFERRDARPNERKGLLGLV